MHGIRGGRPLDVDNDDGIYRVVLRVKSGEEHKNPLLERPGMGGHELNYVSFTRDWRRANVTVHSLLRQQRNLPQKKHARKIDDHVECNG
jgi:hypothetical protein